MYRLKNSNNPIEQNCSALIEGFFPNYELFWDQYIEPLKGLDGNWRNDSLQCLEEIGISQYGVLKSINFILLLCDKIIVGDPLQRYKNIYFHFGLLFDSVKNLARNICIIGDRLGVFSLNENFKKEKVDLLNDYKEWINNNYEDYYKKMIELGKPIFYYPHKEHNFIKILLPNNLRRRYNKFVTNIKKYRNFYIHTPGVDVAVLNTGALYAVKKEYIDLYRHWSTMRNAFPYNRSHFDNPTKIIKNDLNDSISLLDEVWSYFINEMEKISEQKDYTKYLYNYRRAQV